MRGTELDGSPITRAYCARGCSVPDMWTAPGSAFMNLTMSVGSMQEAVRYSPSSLDLTALT